MRNEKEFIDLLNSHEKNRKKKKYFPDYWLKRNYLPEKSYTLALKHYMGTITDEEKRLINVCQPTNYEFWISRGYTHDESKEKVSEIQKGNNARYRQKYTPEERKKFQTTNIEYYLNKGYDLSKSESLMKNRQCTFSYDKVIQKYGKEKGIEIFKERQNKWQKSLKQKSDEEIHDINKRKGITLSNYVSKYGEETGREKYFLWKDEYIERIKRHGAKRYSIESINFFEKYIPDDILQKSFYGDNEYFIRNGDKIYYYDFKFCDIIIEYHGELYHFNPLVDKKESWNNPFGITIQQSLEKDNLKRQLAKEKNYKYFEIYSNDTKEVKQNKIKQILESLHEKNNNQIIQST